MIFGMDLKKKTGQKRFSAGLTLLFLIFFSFAGCHEAKKKSAERPSILFVSLDTLRADHLHCYGYPLETSPTMYRLAGEGAIFKNVMAQSPWTLPSHLSLFTSLYPSSIAGQAGGFKISDGMKPLALCLQEAGYHTAGFTGGGNISAHFGFDRGFDIYDDTGGGIKKIRQKAAAWAKKCDGEDFFLFVHCYDIHLPYVVGEPYDSLFTGDLNSKLVPDTETVVGINRGDIEISETDRKYLIARYDSGIFYADEQLGLLLDDLKQNGLTRNLLVMITSDHGEELGERGIMGWHGHTLYGELLSIPLIFSCPGRIPPGSVIQTRVRGIDIMPTLLDYAGVTSPPGIAGKSLRPLPEGKREEDREVFSQKYASKQFDLRHGLADKKFSTTQFSLIRDQWKYIRFLNKRDELYNAARDPGEIRNLINDERIVAKELGGELKTVMEKYDALQTIVRRPPKDSLDRQTKEQLKKLGYLE